VRTIVGNRGRKKNAIECDTGTVGLNDVGSGVGPKWPTTNGWEERGEKGEKDTAPKKKKNGFSDAANTPRGDAYS